MCPAWGNQPGVFSLTFLVRTTWPSDNHSAYCLCASCLKELTLPWKQKFLVLFYFLVLWYHFCYMNPFLSEKGKCGIFMFWASQSHLWWQLSSLQKCFERGSETACIILVIQGYSDQTHLHQSVCAAGEVKNLCILFPEFSFPFHPERLRRNNILRKTILTHKQSQKEFLVFLQRMQSFYFFLLLWWWELHFFMPQKGHTLNVNNTLPWDLAATAGSVPAGLSPERGPKKVPHSEVCDISSTEKITNTFFF